jgi:hypothetical protein
VSDLGYPMTLARRENWSPGRDGYSIVWVVVHCTDTAYQDDYPTRLGAYWAREATQVSTHYGVSDTEVHQYVRHQDTAFGARNPANLRGIHIELTGRAAWSRAEWLAHGPMLRRAATLIRQISVRHGIPTRGRLLTGAELQARAPGVTSHADLTATFGGTHTDPGSAFPWDVLFGYLSQEQEDEMANSDEILNYARGAYSHAMAGRMELAELTKTVTAEAAADKARDEAMLTAIRGLGAGLDTDAIIAAITANREAAREAAATAAAEAIGRLVDAAASDALPPAAG